MQSLIPIGMASPAQRNSIAPLSAVTASILLDRCRSQNPTHAEVVRPGYSAAADDPLEGGSRSILLVKGLTQFLSSVLRWLAFHFPSLCSAIEQEAFRSRGLI